jgi:hypothetical protein
MNLLLRPICLLREHDFDETKIYRGAAPRTGGCVINPHIKCRRCGKKLPIRPEWMKDKSDLQELMEEEGADLEDVPSLTPEDLERILDKSHRRAQLRRMTSIRKTKSKDEKLDIF